MMPRGIYSIAVLALVAGSLFALRYGLVGHLDLHPPLARMLRQQLGLKDPVEMAKNTRRPPRVPEPDDSNAGVNDPELSQPMPTAATTWKQRGTVEPCRGGGDGAGNCLRTGGYRGQALTKEGPLAFQRHR